MESSNTKDRHRLRKSPFNLMSANMMKETQTKHSTNNTMQKKEGAKRHLWDLSRCFNCSFELRLEEDQEEEEGKEEEVVRGQTYLDWH